MNGEAGPKAGPDTLHEHGSRFAREAARRAEQSLLRQLTRIEHRIAYAVGIVDAAEVRIRELEAERARLEDAIALASRSAA